MSKQLGAWGALAGAAVVVLATQACGDGGAGSGSGAGAGTGVGAGMTTSGNGGSGAGTGTGTGTGVGGAGYVPNFEDDIIPVLENSCGANDAMCHNRGAYGADVDFGCRGWLTLENAPLGSEFYAGPNEGQPTGCPDIPLYDRLMMNAWQCGAPGTPNEALQAYVVPCEPENSYVLHKMNGTLMCDDPGGVGFDTMPPDEPAKASDVALITAWIAAGAPRADGSGTDCGGGEGGGAPVGSPPNAIITHPGDGETRPANVAVPFIGEAPDPEDGQLSGGALVWTSSIDGQLGTGNNFDALLSAGTHTITLEATDSDDNTDVATIQLIMEP